MSSSNNESDRIGGTIPETASYLSEASLVPESQASIPESDGGNLDEGNGLPGGDAYGVKARPVVKKTGMKQKIPYLVFGGLVIFVVGSIGFRVLLGNRNQAAQVQTTVPTQTLAPSAALPSDPQPGIQGITPAETAAKVEPVPVVEPASATPGAASATAEAVPAPHVDKAAQQEVVSKASSPAPVSAVKGVDPSVTAQSKLTASSTQDESRKGTAAPVKAEVTPKASASSASADKGSSAAQSSASGTSAGVKSSAVNCAAPQNKTDATQKKNHKKRLKKITSVTKKESKAPEKTENRKPELVEAAGYKIKVMKNGLVWIAHGDATTVVRVGDQFGDLGVVTKVDESSRRVVIGAHFIEQK